MRTFKEFKYSSFLKITGFCGKSEMLCDNNNNNNKTKAERKRLKCKI